MTKYILHGGFTRRENDSNRTFFEELVRNIPQKGKLLMVFFASTGSAEEKFTDLKNRILKLAGEKDLQIELATPKDFEAQVRASNAVYLHGGHTEQLLEALQQYPQLHDLFEGKTVAGSSAGAYVLGKYGAAHSSNGMREGLGFLPIRIICHYESPELPPAPESVEMLQNTAPELELVLLRDCEWKVFNV